MELEPWIYEMASGLKGYIETDELMIHYTMSGEVWKA